MANWYQTTSATVLVHMDWSIPSQHISGCSTSPRSSKLWPLWSLGGGQGQRVLATGHRGAAAHRPAGECRWSIGWTNWLMEDSIGGYELTCIWVIDKIHRIESRILYFSRDSQCSKEFESAAIMGATTRGLLMSKSIGTSQAWFILPLDLVVASFPEKNHV